MDTSSVVLEEVLLKWLCGLPLHCVPMKSEQLPVDPTDVANVVPEELVQAPRLYTAAAGNERHATWLELFF